MLLARIWRSQPGKFYCLSTKSRSGEWKDHFFRRSQFKELSDFIENNQDKDLYWCPHGFTKPRRVKRYASIPKLLWADLDESNPRALGDLIPSIAWESSPGRFAALWVLDDYMTEELNRRLTYHIGADPGGWDLTQVLRVPGTTNYKYVSTPRVRLLWSDGDSYASKDIEKHLPAPKVTHKSDGPQAIYKKYESKFSGYVRRQLLKGRPQAGKRSEVLWRLVHELIEAGCTRDEAFELLRVSPWNKFKKRRDADEQLRRELEKALEQHFFVEDDESPLAPRFGDEPDDEPDEEYRYLAKSMADVEEENVDWIWYPYLARRELTILEGDPGLGKSYLAQIVAGAIADGSALPSPKKSAMPVQGKIAYFDIENSSGSVTKKRLVANGIKNLSNYYQEEEPFSIDDEPELDNVYDAIEKLRPTLVVFDTLNTYMGKADTHKASETQQTFKRFVDIARRFNCSVLVLRHLTKSSKERALYRGQGSISFTGLARVVMTVGTSPDDPETRVMAVTKINVTRAPKALTFTIRALPDTLKDQDRSEFIWGKYVDLSADEIVASVPKRKEDNGASEFLSDMLPCTFVEIMRSAEARGFTRDQVESAAADLGVVKTKDDGIVEWRLPDEDDIGTRHRAAG